MAIADPSALLRPGLLEGVGVLLGGDGETGFAQAVDGACTGLGARVARVAPPDEADAEAREAATEARVGEALAELGGARTLIVDGAGLFERSAGADGLAETLAGAWDLTRAVANRAFIPASRGGRIVLVAPRPTAGQAHGAPAASGLENLARTLSIEWARYAITTVALAPGPDTTTVELAALCAWLTSPAGAYFSGCLFDLTGPRAGDS